MKLIFKNVNWFGNLFSFKSIFISLKELKDVVNEQGLDFKWHSNFSAKESSYSFKNHNRNITEKIFFLVNILIYKNNDWNFFSEFSTEFPLHLISLFLNFSSNINCSVYFLKIRKCLEHKIQFTFFILHFQRKRLIKY